MDVRKKISDTLSSFVESSVDAYIGLIEPVVSTISERDFNKVVSAVVVAQARAETDLVEITTEAVREAMVSVSFQEAVASPPEWNKPKKDLKSALLPNKDLTAYAPEAPLVMLTPVLEGGFTPPPRLTESEGGSATLEGPGRPDLAAPMGDEFYDPFAPLEHTPPTMTLEQEKRRAAGLPDPYRPTVHFDGKNRVERPPEIPTAPMKAPPQEIAPILVDSPKEELGACLQQLQRIMAPYIESKNKELSMLSCSALVLINRAMGLAEGIRLKAEEPVSGSPAVEVVDDPK